MKKYRDGTLSGEERALLESWYLKLAGSKELDLEKKELETYLKKIEDLQPPEIKEKRIVFGPIVKWTSIAASFLLIAFLGIKHFNNAGSNVQPDRIVLNEDISPGENRAQLTLGSGELISLDKVGAGKVAREGHVSIVKTGDGEITYDRTGNTAGRPASLIYNKVETPKAGQYKVILPDGTKAWLNAASSIRFPASFPADERVVEITGEVYFEVATIEGTGKKIPFRVYAGDQAVEVLGTVFNVNSYADEETIKTTLLEGSIRVKDKSMHGRDIVLKPGQQTLFRPERRSRSADPDRINVKDVNTGSVIAWKEGYFRFDGISLPELMRQLSRWYDMEVIYQNPVGDYEFVGQIERNTRLSKVLKILELGGVQFRIEGKKIIVTG